MVLAAVRNELLWPATMQAFRAAFLQRIAGDMFVVPNFLVVRLTLCVLRFHSNTLAPVIQLLDPVLFPDVHVNDRCTVLNVRIATAAVLSEEEKTQVLRVHQLLIGSKVLRLIRTNMA